MTSEQDALDIDASAERAAEDNALPDWMQDTEPGVILEQSICSYPAVGGHVDVITVLVQGAINDYAAYSAVGRDPEWAYRHGAKIGFEEACVHFPHGQLTEERYRR